MKKRWVFVVVAAVIAIFVASRAFRGDGENVVYRTEPATRGEIVASVSATGTLSAVTTVEVGTQVSGTIKEIYVDYNSQVEKGQLIALINPETFEAQVEQAKANLALAQAGVLKAKATLDDAKRNLERMKQLANRNLIAQSELDAAQTQYALAEAGLSEAQAQVAQAQAALKKAQVDLKNTRIYSPVNGVVISKSVDVGQTVAASFQTPTLFTIAEDLTKMQIETSVDEADIGRVSVGQEVVFTVDAYPSITFSGSVYQVRIEPIKVENVITYTTVVSVENPELKLKPGMTANVTIITDRRPQALRVPSAALRFRPSDHPLAGKISGEAVWIVKDGGIHPIAIESGISDGRYVEVASGEVKEGDLVVVEEGRSTKSSTSRGRRFPF
ncbi:efflux RND transporter periplasmic adaptor subunit [Acetomicrobium sp. S15 = DSM 107314]|uniref:efflux RND transporter periplasmic adaptor subunit n=1 Tax=Acetomicrobium sp. S15 = DSM 107314 TaxID=2529858 RepID=UPI0018E1D5CA|nr:efflux RND transporter periplasmic adaptor subunit [Acetomicrobium sp. S15 = DSM 107314]